MVRIYVFGFVLFLSGSVDCLPSPLLDRDSSLINIVIGTAGIISLKPSIVVTDSFARAIEEAQDAYGLPLYHGYSDDPLSCEAWVVKQERDLSYFSPKCRTRSSFEAASMSVALSSRGQVSAKSIGRDVSNGSRKGK